MVLKELYIVFRSRMLRIVVLFLVILFLLFYFLFFYVVVVVCGGVEGFLMCFDRDGLNYIDWDGFSYYIDCLFVYFYVNRVGVCENWCGVVLFIWEWRGW